MRTLFRRCISGLALASLACAVAASPAAARTPNDRYLSEQWYLQKIRAPEAWDTTLGFEGITIAIIDSGVDIRHPDLKDNIWTNVREIPGNGIDDDGNGFVDDVHGWDFVGNDNDPRPDVSGRFTVLGADHGTIDAGIAAAKGDNGRGIVGVTWQSTIMPLRVLDSMGSGDPEKVVEAVEYAVHNGAKIINLSFAGNNVSPELRIALRRAYDAGVFVVAAAGNAPDGGDAVDLDAKPLYPVCFDRDSDENFVYGVAATDDLDHKAAFSNYGAGCIDLSAPGTHFLSTEYYVPGDKNFGQPYGGYFNGTSLAAAEVSGAVALLWSLDHNLTPKQLVNVLTDSAVKIDAQNAGYFGKLGRGRLDVAAAVQKVLAMIRPQAAPVATASLLPPDAPPGIVVTAPGKGRAPDVRLFTPDGTFVRSFMAFPESFKGGVSLALADFDRTARKTIVAGALAGGAPQVRIFDINTRAIGGFMAYDPGFRGGVNVAAGDLDGDGRDEIVTGAGPGGGPHVRIFAPDGRVVGGFFAASPKVRAGVLVAAGDFEGSGKGEIATAIVGGKAVTIFDAKGKQLRTFAVPAVAGLAAIDVDGDGRPEIVVRSKERAGPVVTAYHADGSVQAALDGETFLPVARKPGEKVGTPDGRMLFGALPGAAPLVRTSSSHRDAVAFAAYERGFLGGVAAVFAP